MSARPRFPLPRPTNPGNNGTATLHDTMESGRTFVSKESMKDSTARRFKVVAYLTGQNATFFHKWAAFDSTNLRTVNNGGSGDTITAGTLFERNCLMLPGRNVFTIVNGATAPTIYEVSAELDGFGGLQQ